MKRPISVIIRTIFLLAAVTALVLFISQYPIGYARSHTPSDHVFTGQASWFDPWDINVYVNAIGMGQRHGFLLENRYTTEPNRPIVMYPVYTLAGILSGDTDPFTIYSRMAFVAAVLLVIGIFLLSGVYIPSWRLRFIAVCVVLFGGGLGFLNYPNPSPDLTMTSFTFASAIQRPHEALGVLSYLTVMTFLYIFVAGRSRAWPIIAGGALALALTLVLYPYTVVIIGLTALLALITVRRGHIRRMIVPAATVIFSGLVPILIVRQQFQVNPTYAGVFNQQLPTPAVWWIAVGYGMMLPAAIAAVFGQLHDSRVKFLAMWASGGILLAYLPLGIARFFLRGLFFPIGILAVLGIKRLAARIAIAPWVVALVFLILVMPSTAYMFVKRAEEVGNNNPWYYLTADEYGTIRYLNTHPSGSGGVLTFYHMGNTIPAFTDSAVYLGHLIQTPDIQTKLVEAASFYTFRMNDDDALAFLHRNNIRYVYWGTEETSLTDRLGTQGNAVHEFAFLTPVYTSDTVVLYEVHR